MIVAIDWVSLVVPILREQGTLRELLLTLYSCVVMIVASALPLKLLTGQRRKLKESFLCGLFWLPRVFHPLNGSISLFLIWLLSWLYLRSQIGIIRILRKSTGDTSWSLAFSSIPLLKVLSCHIGSREGWRIQLRLVLLVVNVLWRILDNVIIHKTLVVPASIGSWVKTADMHTWLDLLVRLRGRDILAEAFLKCLIMMSLPWGRWPHSW